MKGMTFAAFVGPSLAIMLLFIAAPLIAVATQSFLNQARVYQTKTVQDCTPGFPRPVCKDRETSVPVMDAAGAPLTHTVFVGLRNYAALLAPDVVASVVSGPGGLADLMRQPFYQALGFTLLFTFATLPLVILLGLVLAVSLNAAVRSIRGAVIFVSLLPFIVTPVIGALSIRWLFESDGILTDALQAILHHPVEPLTHTWSLQLLMILYRVWNTAPFAFIVFYAGLQTLNLDQVAAAAVDGASRPQVLRYVILPHLAPLILFVAIIHVMDAYRVFDEVIGFSSQARVISLQWLTFNLLTPDESGIRAVGRASASSIMTIIGVFVLLTPLILRFWRDHRQG
jgi:multiple sugar transport system permease protein